jgi:hypothetical protein
LILAYEQRGGPEIEATANALVKKFGAVFIMPKPSCTPGR